MFFSEKYDIMEFKTRNNFLKNFLIKRIFILMKLEFLNSNNNDDGQQF